MGEGEEFTVGILEVRFKVHGSLSDLSVWEGVSG